MLSKSGQYFGLVIEENLMPRHRKNIDTDWLHNRGFSVLFTVLAISDNSSLSRVMQTDSQMGPSHTYLSLCHWLLSSAYLFAFHIVTTVYCKSDSFFQSWFILWRCLLSPDRIFIRPCMSSIRACQVITADFPFLCLNLCHSCNRSRLMSLTLSGCLKSLHLLPIVSCIHHHTKVLMFVWLIYGSFHSCH